VSLLVVPAVTVAVLFPEAAGAARRSIRIDDGNGYWQQAGDAGVGEPLRLPFTLNLHGAEVDTICIGTQGIVTFGLGTCSVFSGTSTVLGGADLSAIGAPVIAPLLTSTPTESLTRSVTFDWGGRPRIEDNGVPVPRWGNVRIGQGAGYNPVYADAAFRVTWSLANPSDPSEVNTFQLVVWRVLADDARGFVNVSPGDTIVEIDYERLEFGSGVLAGIAAPDSAGEWQVTSIQPDETCGVSTPSNSCTWIGPRTARMFAAFRDASDTVEADYVEGRHIIIIPAPDRDNDEVRDLADNCVDVPNPGYYPVPGYYEGEVFQLDSDDDGIGNACDGDLNNDGAVNLADLALFKQQFMKYGGAADFNGDGRVNSLDLGLFKKMFMRPVGPSSLSGAETTTGVFAFPSGERRELAYSDEALYVDWNGTVAVGSEQLRCSVDPYVVGTLNGEFYFDSRYMGGVYNSWEIGTHVFEISIDCGWRGRMARYERIEVRGR
jgi:hypothetical protein